MRAIVVVPPDPVVTVDEAKADLRIDGSDEDTLVGSYVAASTSHIDGPNGWLGRCIGVQTLQAEFPLCRDRIELAYPPIIDVESVTYVDADLAETLVDGAQYALSGNVLHPVTGAQWTSDYSRGGLLRVRYRAGYAISTDPLIPLLPESVKAAILQMTAGLYSRDPSIIAATFASAEMMLSPLRVFA